MVVSTDLLVEGRHFRREWASARDIGRKAAAANLSDINAMGGTAHSLTVGSRRAGGPAGAVGARPGRRHRRGGGAGRRQHRRRRPDHGQEVVVAITVLGTCSGRTGAAQRCRPGRRAGARRAPGLGRRRAGRARAAASAHRGRWWRPTSVRSRRTTPGWPPQSRGHLDDRRLRRPGRRRGPPRRGLGRAPRHLLGRVRARRADARRRVGAGRRPDAVHPRRRRRPRAGGHLPRHLALPEGFLAIGAVGEPEDGQPGVTVDGAAYDGPRGWSHF